jgi:hypothetical protein
MYMILNLGVVISIGIIIIVCGISIVLAISYIDINSDNGNDDTASAFAVVSRNRNDLLLTIKDSKYDYNSIAASKSSVIDGTQIIPTIHPISFAEDTLFPQSFESNPSGSDITLSNGTTLADRPITLVVNKIQSNNTLTLSLHSLNDKYLLTGDLKGAAKLITNSTADNAQFSLKGNINLNKKTSYSVTGTLAESKTKGLTLTVNDAKNSNNFKATIGFSPPHSQGPLAE